MLKHRAEQEEATLWEGGGRMGLPTTSSGGFLTEQEEEEGEWDSLQLLDVAFLLASGGRADSLTPQCATDGWGSVAASWTSRAPAPGHRTS